MATEYVTTKELAVLTSTATSTLRSWRAKGEGPDWCTFGRKVLYRREAVYEYLRSTDTGRGKIAA